MEYGTFQLKLKKRQYSIAGYPNKELGDNFKLEELDPIYKAFVALPNSQVTEYNAFDLYYEGKKIFLEFIALNENNENEMLAFVNKYGLLHSEKEESNEMKNFNYDEYLSHIYSVQKKGYTPENKGGIDSQMILTYLVNRSDDQPAYRENIEYFILEIKKMRLLIQLKQAFDDNNIEKMKSFSMELLAIIQSNYIKSKYPDVNTENFNIFKHVIGNFISDVINVNLLNANPLIVYDATKNLFTSCKGWSCNSLLTAMYVMIYLDFTQGVKFKKCENITCTNWFQIYANDERKKFCDNSCAQAQASREYRKRRKERRV